MGRTRLTTAPGEALVEDGPSDHGERWSPGLALPAEPTWPGRFRRVGITTTLVVLALALAVLFVQLNERGNSFDPSLDRNRFSPAPAEPTPGATMPGEG